MAPLRLGHDRFSSRPDTGIDDRQHHTVRQILHRPQQGEGPSPNVATGDTVIDIDHPNVGCDSGDHTVHDPNELVVEPEVADEGNRSAGHRTAQDTGAAPAPDPTTIAWQLEGAAVTDDIHAPLLDDLARRRGVVMLLGAPDTGKTTFARRLLAAGLAAGKTVAYVDADTDQTTCGPPTCTGLKLVRSQADLDDLSHADLLHFVGSIGAEGVVLQQVVATAALVDAARPEADLTVVDTTSTVSGVVGQTLKYHTMELVHPDVVVGLQRGAELEPVIGMLRRFFSADVETAPVDPDVLPASPDSRRAHRAKNLAAAFAEPLQLWRVRETVFAPTLPAGLDQTRLDGVLVGLQDGEGRCLGLGVLEHSDDKLRVVTNSGEDMRGLRLGSVTMDLATFDLQKFKLRELMFGI